MKIFKIKSFYLVGFVFLVELVIEVSLPNYVSACEHFWRNVAAAPARTIGVNSGSITTGSALGRSFAVSDGRFGLRDNCVNGFRFTTVADSVQTPSGLTSIVTGVTRPVYPTGINNIGFVMQLMEFAGRENINLGQTYDRAWQFTSRIVAVVTFVATGPLNPGIYDLPRRNIVNLNRAVFNGQIETDRATQTLFYSGATVTVTDATCAVLAADRNLQVPLPAVLSSGFRGIDSTLGLQRFTIRVNCPAGVALHATMTDANSPANTSNILTLAQDSTATGVGLQISATDRPHVVSYGADSRVAGNNNQWLVGGNATSPPTNHIIPFTVRYVQTAAAVQPGTVRARSTITFSYQ